jgi:hypothetical protein
MPAPSVSGLLSWEQQRDKTWSCPEGGILWRGAEWSPWVGDPKPTGRRWEWSIAGRSGWCSTLPEAVAAAGAAWRGDGALGSNSQDPGASTTCSGSVTG